MDPLSSLPSTPPSPTRHADEHTAAGAGGGSKSLHHSSKPLLPGGSHPPPPGQASLERNLNLELLREQLRAAKMNVPVSSKRSSLTASELPHSAADCSLIPGTSRCALELCADECALPHRHHRSHARPTDPSAPLVLSRPSLSSVVSSTVTSSAASPWASPAPSVPASANTSPQATYRRASAYGFPIGVGAGSNRGSMVSVASGMSTPAELNASNPPSPLSHSDLQLQLGGADQRSAPTSAPQSPNAHPVHDILAQPIAEENEVAAAASSQPQQQQQVQEAASVPSAITAAAPSSDTGSSLDTDYWRVHGRIVNLSDYRPPAVEKDSEESRRRLDLAPAPRDDCPEQGDVFWDPRSPNPPSPVQLRAAQIVRANLVEDGRNPTIEYELKVTQ